MVVIRSQRYSRRPGRFSSDTFLAICFCQRCDLRRRAANDIAGVLPGVTELLHRESHACKHARVTMSKSGTDPDIEKATAEPGQAESPFFAIGKGGKPVRPSVAEDVEGGGDGDKAQDPPRLSFAEVAAQGGGRLRPPSPGSVSSIRKQSTIKASTELVSGPIGEPANFARFAEALDKISMQINALSERTLQLERGRRHEAEMASNSEYSSEGSGYTSSSSSAYATSTEYSEGGGDYARVQPDCGHWKAKELAHDVDQEPHRYSLHGYEPFDGLKDGRHGGGGSLGLALKWMEPACLYLKTGCDALQGLVEGLDAFGSTLDRDARRELGSYLRQLGRVANTIQGSFDLANTYRTLIVERAKVQAPGASQGAKKRQQWVESQIDEDDYALPDVAPRIRSLKAEYDYEAGRADLKRAANAGGAAAGGGYDRRREREERDRDRPRDGEHRRREPHPSAPGAKTRTQKRRERRERNEGSGDRERPKRGSEGDRERNAKDARDGQPRGEATRSAGDAGSGKGNGGGAGGGGGSAKKERSNKPAGRRDAGGGSARDQDGDAARRGGGRERNGRGPGGGTRRGRSGSDSDGYSS